MKTAKPKKNKSRKAAKKRNSVKPSAAQLRARRKLAAANRARAKAARSKKGAKKRNATKRPSAASAKRPRAAVRNSSDALKDLVRQAKALEKAANAASKQAGIAWQKLFAAPDHSAEAKHWKSRWEKWDAEASRLRKEAGKLFDKYSAQIERTRGAKKKNPTKKHRNPRYFLTGIDVRGREHDLAVRVAPNKMQAVAWAKKAYPGYSKIAATLSDKADFIGRAGMIKAKRPKASKKRNPNSTAKEQRRDFAGKVGKDITLHFPTKNLQGLSTLGPLVSLQGEFGEIKPVHGGVYYARDAKGRIHIGSKEKGDLWTHTKENLGAVRRVEYRAAKPHLGYPNVVTWYHDFEAPYPTLKSDGDGGLLQVGGGYTIRREGIVG